MDHTFHDGSARLTEGIHEAALVIGVAVVLAPAADDDGAAHQQHADGGIEGRHGPHLEAHHQAVRQQSGDDRDEAVAQEHCH